MGQNLITGYQGADRQIFTQQVYRNNFATPPINLQNIDSGAVEMNYIAPGDTIAKTYFHFINGSQGNAANSHLAYDPVLDVWTTKALNPTVRTGIAFAGTSAKDKLYGFGGTGSTANTVTSEVIEYVGSTNTWAVKTTTGSMTARMYASACLGGDGKIYVMGGHDNAATPVFKQINECYDPTANSWTVKANMTASARRNPTLVAFPSANLICLLGGIINTSGYTPSTPDAYTFNTQNNTWATKVAPPFSKTWSYPVLYNGLLYFMGGYHNPSGSSSSDTNVRTWNPVTDTWVAKCYNFDITNNNSYSDYTTDYGSPCFLYNNLIYLPHSNVPYNKTYKPEDDIVTNGTGMSDNKLITLVSQYPNPAVVQYLAALRTMSKIYDALGTTIMDGYYQTPYMYTYGSNKFAGGTNQYAYMAMPPFDIKCDQSPWSYQSYTKANILLY